MICLLLPFAIYGEPTSFAEVLNGANHLLGLKKVHTVNFFMKDQLIKSLYEFFKKINTLAPCIRWS